MCDSIKRSDGFRASARIAEPDQYEAANKPRNFAILLMPLHDMIAEPSSSMND
jgi:hypothetical protein